MTAKLNMNISAAQAVEYVRHGFSLCAIPHGEKGPRVKGWNLRENAITQASAAVALTGNIGLLHAYSRTMALDIDSITAASEYLLARGVNLGQLFAAPDRVEIVSGRAGRGKLLFRLPVDLNRCPSTLQVKGDNGSMVLEFRCADAGGNSVQDVLPPSVHPGTGQPYQWIGDWRNLPTIPGNLLEVWQVELGNKSLGAVPAASGSLPLGFAPQGFASELGFPPLEENLWGMTVLDSALDHLSPDVSYPEWRNMGWAILSTGWKSAPKIVHSWSKLALHRYSAATTDALIHGFDPSKGITIATLFYRAKQSGWTLPQQQAVMVAPVVPQSPALLTSPVDKSVDWSVPGDVRNARHFAALFRGVLLYVYGLKKWLRWSGGHWVLCDRGQEIEAAKHAAIAMLKDATANFGAEHDGGKWRAREAMAAHGIARIKATLELAQSEPGMSTGHADLDANLFMLGVANGVVDLRSGAIMANRPELLITRQCAADYDLGLPCSRWLQFLDEVFGSDQATIAAIQRLLGYTLTGLNIEEIMIFCVGFGANGKSIFGNIVSRIMGGYAKVAPHSLLAARRGDDHSARGDIAMLPGARLVSVNELPGGMHLDEQAVKVLAGRESISARPLYGEFFDFDPRFTVWVRTNHRPIIRGDDDGIWRRIIVLPFRQRFDDMRRDPHLEAKLWKERGGILRWMIEGARLYLAAGNLCLSPAILAEQRRYRRESDLLGEFLDECTIGDAVGRVLDKDLFQRWCNWGVGNGQKSGTKATFTQRLAERGFAISRSNGRRYYAGLRMKL